MWHVRERTVWAGRLLLVVAGSCSDTGTNRQATNDVLPDPSAAATGASPSSAGAVGNTGAGGMSAVVGSPPATAGAASSSDPGAGGMPGNAAGENGAAGVTDPMGDGGAPSTGGSGPDAGPGADGGRQPTLPPPPADCPTLATGMVTVMGQQVRLWVGPQRGPMVFYWHGTGSRAEEALYSFRPGIDEVMAQGGVVASFTTTTEMGRTTGNYVWYTADFEMADEIVACANQQGLIDPQRIYSAGCSAGGIQTSSMAYMRSSYLAASTPNSGGIVFPTELEDPSHVPFQMSSHGDRELDVVRAGQASASIDVYFADITANNNNDLVSKGGFAINCDHGGQHCANPPELTAAIWEFLKAHTFGTVTSPYAAELPASFPSYCQIVR